MLLCGRMELGGRVLCANTLIGEKEGLCGLGPEPRDGRENVRVWENTWFMSDIGLLGSFT